MNKKQQKQFDHYVKKLGLTTTGELWTLEKILTLDWNRSTILIEITEVKSLLGTVLIKCVTNVSGYHTSIPDITGRENDAQLVSYAYGDFLRKVK